jgi:hypothetical protein
VWLWVSFRPWWVQWPVYGLVLALGLDPFVLIGDYPDRRLFSHGTGLWLLDIAATALLMGLLVALKNAERLAQLRPAVTPLSVLACRQVSKALKSGPVPADPAIRHVPVLLAQRTLGTATSSARLLVVVAVLNALAQAANFLVNPHHFTLMGLVLVVLFAVLGTYYWNYPRLLDARYRLLLGNVSAQPFDAVLGKDIGSTYMLIGARCHQAWSLRSSAQVVKRYW